MSRLQNLKCRLGQHLWSPFKYSTKEGEYQRVCLNPNCYIEEHVPARVALFKEPKKYRVPYHAWPPELRKSEEDDD